MPAGPAATRPGFLVRNRIIAALSRGTVVVEAALRSGALNTARHARELCRPVMAVPGPVTSELSAGCHELIREYGAMCVTCARDVIEHLQSSAAGPAVARDLLDPATRAVLEQVPAGGGAGRPPLPSARGLTWTQPCGASAPCQQPAPSGGVTTAGGSPNPTDLAPEPRPGAALSKTQMPTVTGLAITVAARRVVRRGRAARRVHHHHTPRGCQAGPAHPRPLSASIAASKRHD